jgi:hypothetical protein
MQAISLQLCRRAIAIGLCLASAIAPLASFAQAPKRPPEGPGDLRKAVETVRKKITAPAPSRPAATVKPRVEMLVEGAAGIG